MFNFLLLTTCFGSVLFSKLYKIENDAQNDNPWKAQQICFNIALGNLCFLNFFGSLTENSSRY